MLTLSLFSAGVWDPLLLANARGGFSPIFHVRPLHPSSAHEHEAHAGTFFSSFSFFFADRPALLFAPSPHVATCCPSPRATPRHALRIATPRFSPRAAPHHAPHFAMRRPHHAPRFATPRPSSHPFASRRVTRVICRAGPGASPFHVVATSRRSVWTWRWRRWCGLAGGGRLGHASAGSSSNTLTCD